MKTKTRYFLLCTGAISIVVGIAFLPSRWLYILYGVLAFVIGSVVQTEEWKTGKKVRAIVFIIAIAVGGLFATKGWNEWGNHSQKKALVVALAREWLLNDLYTRNEPMSFDANDPNLGKEHFVYPEFRTSAQDRILTSALFDMNNRSDKKLIFSVFLYNDTIKKFNVQLSLINEDCVRFPENVKQHVKQQKRKKVYLMIRDKSPLHMHFRRFHKELLELLEKEYNWALIEARLTLANIHRLQEQQ